MLCYVRCYDYGYGLTVMSGVQASRDLRQDVYGLRHGHGYREIRIRQYGYDGYGHDGYGYDRHVTVPVSFTMLGYEIYVGWLCRYYDRTVTVQYDNGTV